VKQKQRDAAACASVSDSLIRIGTFFRFSRDVDVDMTRDLTPAEQSVVAEAFATGENVVIVDAFSIPLQGVHVQCLRDKCWLNDEIVNFHVQLLRARAERRHARATVAGSWSIEATPRCHFFSTFFYLKLAKTADGPYVYNNVQRWTRRLELSIFACDLVLLPIHVHDSHWCLVNIDMRTKTLRYWDSLRAGIDEGCLQVCDARSLFLSLSLDRSLALSLARSHSIAHSLSP